MVVYFLVLVWSAWCRGGVALAFKLEEIVILRWRDAWFFNGRIPVMSTTGNMSFRQSIDHRELFRALLWNFDITYLACYTC